ncbi:hypothetical protein [Nocardioides panaciterrulae]|uniref:YfhO family protein n=1 Tax=Nocardioides panaciterrulae TaxID=661492 RepID=A0A7Y9JA96_9ACTN|nr:hypothetical protein [Nocardioides panaciterrulae]NYD41545.1 hypothetical protein [Nocardioides panaciterrulae]
MSTGPVLRLLPRAWAVLLPLLLLGPALGAGYVLSYDMVWVPDLAMRPDFLGLGTALPRAVPSDAVVAVLDELVPGMLLQKVVLLGALLLAGFGALRLAGGTPVGGLAAVSVYVWNPFVAERLGLGHWTVLLGYAVLPWLVLEGARYRRGERVGVLPWLLLPLGSLSAGAGLASALALLVPGLGRGRRRRNLLLVAACLAANAPWLVAGLLHVTTATSTTAGSVFRLGREGSLPGPLAALTLGGVWNSEVVPGSRHSLLLTGLGTVALVGAAAYGLRPLRRRLGDRTTGALVGLWAVGFLLAAGTWALPGATGRLAAHVPGGGLLRDGGRWLALCGPLLAALVAAALDRLAVRVRDADARVLVALAGALLPLALLPDAAWGLAGRLQPVSYPADYAAARAAVAASPAPGDVLLLPFTSYRAPSWNHDRKVLDPVGRYLTRDYLASDELGVSRQVLAGEDPRVPQVLAALQADDPAQRAQRLGSLGVGLVVQEHGVPASSRYDAPVAGTVVHRGPALTVTRVDAPVQERTSSLGRVAMVAGGWTAYLAGPLVAIVPVLWRKRRKRADSGPTGW